MGNNTMIASDAVYASKAECYITIDGRRYNFMQLVEFDSHWKSKIVDVPILGKIGMGHKPAGGVGEWSAKAHYNQSVLRDIALKYQKTGVMPYFDIQVTNEDPQADCGRQTIILHGCLVEDFTLAKFAAGEDVLQEDISGTFESWDMPEEFVLLQGME